MAEVINRGKPLPKVKKDAIIEGLTGMIASYEKRLDDLKKELEDVKKHPQED